MSHNRVFAIYDISSSSVAGAHVLRSDTAPVILASFRSEAPLQEEMDMERFVEETVKHLTVAVDKVKALDVHHPDSIQVVLASPWYSSQTRTIVYTQPQEFTCTQKLIDNLVDTEIKSIMKDGEAAFVAFGDQSVIVEKQLSAIKLNGYHTNTPFGKHATTLELFLTITIAPKPVLDRFTDVLRRSYGARTISYTTSPFTTFVVMRDLDPTKDEACIVDVGEEITDVAFIKGGIMLYQHSFPVGTFGLYRALAGRSTNTVRESMALLETYRLGKLAPGASKGVETAIDAFVKHWQSWLHQVIEGEQYGFCLPAHCVVTSDPRFQELFMKVLTTDEFIKHRCAVGDNKVMYLNEETIGGLVKLSSDAPFDVPLATTALYITKI